MICAAQPVAARYIIAGAFGDGGGPQGAVGIVAALNEFKGQMKTMAGLAAAGVGAYNAAMSHLVLLIIRIISPAL